MSGRWLKLTALVILGAVAYLFILYYGEAFKSWCINAWSWFKSMFCSVVSYVKDFFRDLKDTVCKGISAAYDRFTAMFATQ